MNQFIIGSEVQDIRSVENLDHTVEEFVYSSRLVGKCPPRNYAVERCAGSELTVAVKYRQRQRHMGVVCQESGSLRRNRESKCVSGVTYVVGVR